jgi:hypothetical protein
LVAVVLEQEHQVLAQAVVAELEIFLQEVLAHQEQEQVLAEVEAEQDLPLMVLLQLLMLAVTAAQVVVVEALAQH